MAAVKRALEAAPEPVQDEIDEVEVAKGEVLDEAKTIDFYGVALTCPPKLPASMLFDLTESEVEEDEGAGNVMVHAVYKLLGKEQWARAKKVADEHNLSADDFGPFIEQVLRAYGFGPGESSPSSDSSESDGA